MSDEQELKLACLHQAGGNLDHAKALFDWVSGSVRATPASVASAVSAPDQDKPEQPFNYQHPSKYGTNVPRRCYLEELTPEERAICDLVSAIEHLGAHPLLTTTVIQLMKAGESLADWVDIGLRDKAIAALTSEPETHTGNGGEEFLLETQSPSVDDEVRNQAEDAPPEVASEGETKSDDEWHGENASAQVRSAEERGAEDQAAFDRGFKDGLEGGISAGVESSAYHEGWGLGDHTRIMAQIEREALAELGLSPDDGWQRHLGGECPVEDITHVDITLRDRADTEHQRNRIASSLRWKHADEGGYNGSDILAFRIIETLAEAERTEDVSQAEPVIEQEQKDEGAPVLDALPPSIPRSEIPEGAAVETFKDTGVETVKIGGITRIVEDVADQGQGDASVFAHGILEETKAEPERPSLIDRILGRVVPA